MESYLEPVSPWTDNPWSPNLSILGSLLVGVCTISKDADRGSKEGT